MNRVADPPAARFAADVGDAGLVAVEGGRTRWEAGGPLAAGARLVRAPAGVIAYQPEEMTVHVRAGTPVAELHAVLAERGQRTALPERGGTVGGAVAVGENHPCMLGRGALRAGVLQVRYVSAEGRLVTGGGPTVKNVSGYDLPRLLVGSLGALGALADVILRTNPLPAASVWLRADGADPRAVRGAVARPGAILWDGTSTWVLLEGHAPDVAAMRERLGMLGAFAEVDGPPALPPHRWSLPPAELYGLDGAATGPFVAAIGAGLAFASRPQPRRELSPAVIGLHARMKANFDPVGRLNPGRDPAAR